MELITSDDHHGLKEAMKAVLTGVSWNRCHVHLQRNVVAYIPKVVMVFPNEKSITRLVSALLMEVSQDWETDNVYVRLDEGHEVAE